MLNLKIVMWKNVLASETIDKGKFILGAPPK